MPGKFEADLCWFVKIRNDFKVTLDIFSPIDDISSDKSDVINDATSTSENTSLMGAIPDQRVTSSFPN